MKAIFDDTNGSFRVGNPSGYVVADVRKCADAYFIQANGVPCFAVMDDFGNLVRVPA